MTRSALPDVEAEPMDDQGVEGLLRERGFGVLSLAADDTAYAVPMSFGYRDEQLYFAFLLTGEGSVKQSFSERTELASFLVFDVASKSEWRSVVAFGELRELDEADWESAVLAVRSNGWHPDLFGRATPTQGIQWWTLDIEAVTGRKSAAGE